MLVYSGSKNSFMADVENDVIADKISEQFRFYLFKPKEAEQRAWRNSMVYMYKVLNDDEIPDSSGISIEYNIPGTGKRVDFILTGTDSDHSEAVIIIELKQWEDCSAVLNQDGIVATYVGGGIRNVSHPSYQALCYADHIRDYNLTVQEENISIIPCAYLHNYLSRDNDPIKLPHYQVYLQQAPLFIRKETIQLREFIKKYIKYGDNKKLLYRIDNGKIRPSKSLQDTLASMMNGNPEFMLMDEQKVIYEAILSSVIANSEDRKQVFIVKGGPGTGKTVLAINLLVAINNNDLACHYVTKNSSPRDVFHRKLKGSFPTNRAKNLFQSSDNYVNSQKNSVTCLIVDEAHRLREKSGFMNNQGENQIKEIINSSVNSVFFIDEDQRVTLSDIGRQELIVKFANEAQADISIMELESQFRCNGSDGYLNWLDNLLDIRETANYGFDFNYDFQVFDDPNELFEIIKQKNSVNNKSRVVAGYCWEWVSRTRDESDVYDITMPEYGFNKSWNLNRNRSTWAIENDSIEQVGCIHTSQGLEFDYVGVIIGDDLRYENNQIVTDYKKRASTDASLKGIKTLIKKDEVFGLAEADLIIKNTYRTLMTRGMKGCYIFCTNKELSDYIKSKLNRYSI